MSDRHGPGSTRRNPRKKPRYESSSEDGRSAVCSEKDGDSDSGGSYTPARRSSSRSHHHHHQTHHRDQSRSSHRSHSHRNHQRSHRHSHHRRQKLLGPAEHDEKPRDGMALAVREEYQVQTVPRAHTHRSDDSDDDEEVYDHRPKPVSHRGHSHVGVSGRRGAGGSHASDAEKGFFMAAAALAVSFIICCGDADND